MRLSTLMEKYSPTTINPELFQEMNKIDIEEYIRQDGNRKTEYISWSVMHYLFLKHFPPGFTPVTLLSNNDLPYHPMPLVNMLLPDEPELVESTATGGFVCTALVDSVNMKYTGLTWSPIMTKNKMNSAVLIPNAREIADAIQRCTVKTISSSTGIGFVLYTQFEFDTAEQSKPANKPPAFRTSTNTQVDTVDDEGGYDNDEDKYDDEENYGNHDAPRTQQRRRQNQPRFGGSLRGRV